MLLQDARNIAYIPHIGAFHGRRENRSLYRIRSQIPMLGRRLLPNHMDRQEDIDKILDFLCSESGSHDYTVYRREARELLGLPIETPSWQGNRI